MERKNIKDIYLFGFYYDGENLIYIFSFQEKQTTHNVEIADKNAYPLELANSKLEARNITLVCSKEEYANFYRDLCDNVTKKINAVKQQNPGIPDTQLFPRPNFSEWE